MWSERDLEDVLVAHAPVVAFFWGDQTLACSGDVGLISEALQNNVAAPSDAAEEQTFIYVCELSRSGIPFEEVEAVLCVAEPLPPLLC